MCVDLFEEGGNHYGSGIGYHGNIFLKPNSGAGEAEIEGLIYWEGRGEPQTECSILLVVWNFHETVKNSKVVKACNPHH